MAIRRKTKIKIFVYTSIFFAGGLVIGLLYVLIYSPIFKVKGFSVQKEGFSNEDIYMATMIEIAKEHPILSIFGPENIFFWELGGKPNYLASLPEIKKISMDVSFLKQQITISPEEREVEYVLCKENNCFQVDEEGVIFNEAPNMKGFLITKIKDESIRNYSFGSKFLPNEKWTQNIFYVLGVLKKNKMPIKEVQIKEDILEEYEIILESGVYFRFDLELVPENFENVVKNITTTLSLDKITYIDFRIPNKIFYK